MHLNKLPNGSCKVALSGHRAAAVRRSNKAGKQLCTCGIPTSSSGSQGTNSHLIKNFFFFCLESVTHFFSFFRFNCQTSHEDKKKTKPPSISHCGLALAVIKTVLGLIMQLKTNQWVNKIITPKRDCVAQLTKLCRKLCVFFSFLPSSRPSLQITTESDGRRTNRIVTVGLRRCECDIIDFRLNSVPKEKEDKKADGKK